MRGLSLLIRFMTRLPLPGKEEFDNEELGKSLKLFPLIGIIIGIILYAVYFVLGSFIENKYAIAIILVLTEVVITGGLHLDGLADTFDGIFSYRSKSRMLEIMKDSRIGSNGALSLIIYFLLKTFLMVEVGFEAVLIFPVIGRVNSVVNAALAPYARPTGMAKTLVKYTDKKGLALAAAIAVIFIFALSPVLGTAVLPWIATLAISMGAGIFFAKLMERKIGGVTGDTLGAIVELTEVFALLIICIFI